MLPISLGIAQLLAWGTLYYAIAVIGAPMQQELGLSSTELFGVFTWSLVLSGLLAPWAGRLLDRRGGRFVLAGSGMTGACGFAALASVSSRFELYASWTLLGVTMALGLYDTCFAALAHAAPANYRKSVTGVTLIAGLASTVAWPVSHQLLQTSTWRGACFLYAGAQLACSVIYVCVLPASHVPIAREAQHPAHAAEVQRLSRLLALAFAGAAFIAGAFSAHLIQTLTALHIGHERAVWLASTVGITQVGGRLIESMFGERHSAMAVGYVTFGGLALSTAMLLGVSIVPWLVLPFVVLYGAANGLITICKAAIPVELLGFEGAGATLGNFSAPSLLTRAAAPFAFAVLTDISGLTGTLIALTSVGALSLGAFVYLTRAHKPIEA